MRKVSRRGILAGLLATSATPAAAFEQAPPVACDMPIGYILPRITHELMPVFSPLGAYPVQAVCKIVHDIWDGEKFVPLDSDEGQVVVRELGG